MADGGVRAARPPPPPPPPPNNDCFSCRLTGTGVCLVAAASLAWRAGDRVVGGHRATLVGGAAVFAALAVWRWRA